MESLRITLPIAPGLLAINRKHTPQTRKRKSDDTRYTAIGVCPIWKAAFNEAVIHVRQAKVRSGWRTRDRDVFVSILNMWPEEKGDVDANSKSVLDVLQAAGVVSDDKLCRPVLLDRLWRCPPGEIVILVEDRNAP